MRRVSRGAKLLSKSVVKRLGRRDASKSDGALEIIEFRGVSMRLMVETKEAVEDGTAAVGVRLVVALVDLSPEVKEGSTVKLTGEGTGTVAYRGSVTFRPEQVREKPRSEWTTEDVAEHVVLAATLAKECIYLDVIEKKEEDVGKEYQGAFVSQARSCTFASLVTALVAHYEKQGVDPRTQFVWLDVFSANQPLLTSQDSDPRVQQERYELLTKGLHEAIDKFDERLIFFDTWDAPKPLGRAWCVWELYGSIRMDKPVQPIFAPGQDQAFLDVLRRDADDITQTFADIDTRNAACFSADDKAMIDAAVEEQLRDGYTTLNADILTSLRGWLTEITHAAITKAKEGLAEDDEEAQIAYARVLHQAGYFIAGQAKHEEALAYYEEALRIKKAVLGEQDRAVAATLNNIAAVHDDQGRHGEALAYYEEALRILKAKLGEDHPDVATALNNIAAVYDNQGRHEEALVHYKKSLSIKKEALGEQHPEVASTLNNIGLLYDNQGKYVEALAYYEEALDIVKAQLGEQHPNVASMLNNIAMVYYAQGKHEEALPYCVEALGIYKAKLGEQHPSVATTLSTIAAVYYAQGKYEEAVAHYEQALGITKEALGEEHPDVASMLNNIAAVYEGQGNRAEALRLLRQALDIRKNVLGEAHTDTVDTQAALDSLTSESDQAR